MALPAGRSLTEVVMSWWLLVIPAVVLAVLAFLDWIRGGLPRECDRWPDEG